MNIIQCRLCRKPFQSQSSNICPNCHQKLDSTFIEAREFIYKNPKTGNIKDIVKDTELEEKYLLHLVREGRLQFKTSSTDQPLPGLSCQTCKKPIFQGTICNDCRDALAKQLAEAMPAAEPEKVKKTARPKNNSLMNVKSRRGK